MVTDYYVWLVYDSLLSRLDKHNSKSTSGSEANELVLAVTLLYTWRPSSRLGNWLSVIMQRL